MNLPYAPLHLPQFERDACGVGFVAQLDGRPRHDILRLALRAAANLSHRGALDADGRTGDGAGILTQIPQKLIRREIGRLAGRSADKESITVGMVFMPRQSETECRRIIDLMLDREGFERLAWRVVPVDRSALGSKAAATEPAVLQVAVCLKAELGEDALARKLLLTRRRIEKALADQGLGKCHFASFSHRSLVYKALLVAPDLPRYFLDLRDPDFETALAIFHQRYSTNTAPDWSLAQPLRMLAHNGEINTISGNRNWMRAREPELCSPLWGTGLQDLLPIIGAAGSDSASLDNVFELLSVSGRPLDEVVMQLVPEAHAACPGMPDSVRAFYEYKECLSEPWDGPAAMVFSDGNVVGAALDRNGLRPARFKVTRDGLVLLASEAGVLELEDLEVVAKGRLGPGEIVLADIGTGRFLSNQEIKTKVASRLPYRAWLQTSQLRPPAHASGSTPELFSDLRQRQRVFGWTQEDEKLILGPMAAEAKEPLGSMGNDTPLAVLSLRPRLLYDFFHQLFAQVTNPPIDPLREHLVMSLRTLLGPRPGFLDDREEHARQIVLSTPVLDGRDFAWLVRQGPPYSARTVDATFPASAGEPGLEQAVERLVNEAEAHVRSGAPLVILSDRPVSPERAPVPALLAVAATHNHLIRRGLRMRASLIACSGEPRSDHHFATLLGYGADAVFPYLAYSAVANMARESQVPGASPAEALSRYRGTIEKGILKIMSKMGISVLASYRGAQLFEAVGLCPDLIDRYFTGTPSRVGGIGLSEIARDTMSRHRAAYAEARDRPLEEAGLFRFRKSGEHHAFNPPVFKQLHKLAQSGAYEDYRQLLAAVAAGEPVNLRDCVRLRPGKPVPLGEVEPASEILKRFSSASMSLGALSSEAHETLAIAMNRIGAKSGSGEGGEDPKRRDPLPNGDSSCSKIKQVASGRFGVTPSYLCSAEEIEIKMAQGSKPGEGGQLPGHKVTAEIAELRHATPGQPLISPPPHHDIYSIEDLAQLIYDLKQVNPRAAVAVKLVAAPGIGAIAAGVAKADADIVHISAYDGGTGASPLDSIKHAGLPWELGLAEAEQVLIASGLRGRVRLRVDGGMRTARDLAVAAALGADEFGFGSALLVAAGCVMARQCHLNTCPVGIATQDGALRARFTGRPEMAINYLRAIAEDLRELLAAMGLRTLGELIGRTDLLLVDLPPGHHKAKLLDLGAILSCAGREAGATVRHRGRRDSRGHLHQDRRLNEQILIDAQPAIEAGESLALDYRVSNADRSVGTGLAGEIAVRYGEKGLAEGSITCNLRGSAGQSLGAFLARGIRLIVTGEANDYAGKGMAGGEIVIRPAEKRSFDAAKSTILGNTALYGATGGFLFAAGLAGERFAVRNSGAVAVVEGVGNHGCEYMTRGTVVVLGPTGSNFAAGMTGGMAYVLDRDGHFARRVNPDLVAVARLEEGPAADDLLRLIDRHRMATGSDLAAAIIRDWERNRQLFWEVTGTPATAQAGPRADRLLPSQTPAGVAAIGA